MEFILRPGNVSGSLDAQARQFKSILFAQTLPWALDSNMRTPLKIRMVCESNCRIFGKSIEIATADRRKVAGLF